MLNPAHGYTKCVQKPARPWHPHVCVSVCARLCFMRLNQCNARWGHAASLTLTNVWRYVLVAGGRAVAPPQPSLQYPPSVWPACCSFFLFFKKKKRVEITFFFHTPAPAERPWCFGNPPPSPSRRGKLWGWWFPLLSHPACLSSAERLIASQSRSFSFRCSSIWTWQEKEKKNCERRSGGENRGQEIKG